MTLTRTVVAGPRHHTTGMPRRLDACGAFIGGGRAPWSFETLAGGRSTPTGEAGPSPVWRLRTGFGATEVGCVIVGLALALANTPGAEAAGVALIRRRRLHPGQEVIVVPEVVQAARPVTELPLAVVMTAMDDADDVQRALEATPRWSVTLARP